MSEIEFSKSKVKEWGEKRELTKFLNEYNKCLMELVIFVHWIIQRDALQMELFQSTEIVAEINTGREE